MSLHLQFTDTTIVNIYAKLQGAAEKSGPLNFSLFSQQPFGILIRNFTALFTETFYI